MSDDPPQAGRIEVVRTIEAPREEVFRAWTDPDQLRSWWGPGEFTCPEAGRWQTGPAADGSESLVSVEFRDRGNRTELVLTHTDFPASHGPAPYQMRWDRGLDKFERLFAGSAVDA